VVLAGAAANSVHVLLRSPRFGQLLEEARQRFDFVVLDTPPLVPVVDAAVLSRVIDGMLIVVAADETPRRLLEAALNQVDESKVLGIVFNGDTSRVGRYDGYSAESGVVYGRRPAATARQERPGSLNLSS
jgi:Mrp family chromosome partitioning ATPase